MALGGEIGGHLVQGHIDGVGKVVSVRPEGNARIFRFSAPPQIMYYLVEKGFIAIEGISLTVTALGSDYFEVSVIEFTFNNTVLQYGKPAIRSIWKSISWPSMPSVSHKTAFSNQLRIST